MKQNSILLFDIDGVIVRGEHFADTLIREHNITREMTAPFFRDIFHDCLMGNADLKTSITPFLSQWGWRGTVDEFINYWFQSHSTVDTRVLKLVQKLREKGLPCYLATNQEQYRKHYLWEQLEFKKYFDGMFSSCDLHELKTDPKFFVDIASILQTKPTNLLFFDDTFSHVQSAKQAGVNARVYTEFEAFEDFMKE